MYLKKYLSVFLVLVSLMIFGGAAAAQFDTEASGPLDVLKERDENLVVVD